MGKTSTAQSGMYRIGGYGVEIPHDGENIGWWATLDDDSVISGRGVVDHDTLVLSPWKVRTGVADPEVVDLPPIASLPAWDQSRYFVKLADLGWSGLLYAENMEEVPGAEAQPVLQALGLVQDVAE